jgi:hypothetical protein
MPDIASIAAVFTSIKTATDIVKLLRESDLSLERAELKLRLADLVSALAEAKMDLTEIQEVLVAKDKRITELEEAFESKDALVKQNDAFYVADENGNPAGAPYCFRCWENDHKKRQLVHDSKEWRKRVCTACGHRYDGNLAFDIPPKEKPAARRREPNDLQGNS